MRRAARVLLFNVAASAAILLALEAASRLIVPVALPDPLLTATDAGSAGAAVYDPLLFWRIRPHLRRDGRTLTNSLGQRGEELPAKTPQEFRILSLGESTTFARRLPPEQSYSALLERELGSVAGRRVRVINAGVPGYSLFQGVSYLRHRGLALEPDAVMTYFGYNDFLPISVGRAPGSAGPGPGPRASGMTDRELFARRRSLRGRTVHALLEHSNLARLALRRAQPERAQVRPSGGPRVPEADRRWLLGELREICREHDLRLVILIPWYRDFREHESLLREAAGWEGVVVVDLPAKLAALDTSRASFFADGLHPNREGHRLIAQAIAEALGSVWDVSGP